MAEPAVGREGQAVPRRRTLFGPALLVGLSGSALATAAATRPWAEATTREVGRRTEVASGPDVAPLVLPLALVALAAWGTVLVLRRTGRRVVSVLGLLASAGGGAAALVQADRAPTVALQALGEVNEATTTTTTWPALAVTGCALSALAFAVALWRASSWPEMSSKYDAPSSQRAPGAAGPDARDSRGTGSGSGRPGPGRPDLWTALDAGQDPTDD